MILITTIIIFTALYGYMLAALSTQMPSNGARGIDDLFFVLMVPALNEEQVIGRTISSLLDLRGNFLVLVIDDASDDGTVAAIKPFLADPRVRLMEQPPERARRGKGHVLNTGYAAIRQMGLPERYGAQNMIVTVFDSDARVNPGFLEDVAAYFRAPEVAGVQSTVRMYNADHNLLTLWQNLEFAIWGRVMCQAKNRLKSATLGGNGQCVRLSALGDLGQEPWQSTSLAEDLDLSLRLLTAGWQLRFCTSATVWQEAVTEFGKLVRQRSRWMQGHLACWSYLPGLLRGQLPLRARVDLLVFLLLPAAIVPVGLATLVTWGQFLLHFGGWRAWNLAAFYALGFVVAPLAVAYLARVERRGLLRSILHGHLFIFYSFVWFLAAVAAWQKILLGRHGWAKTGRVAAEDGTRPLVAHAAETGSTTLNIRVLQELLATFALSALLVGALFLSWPVISEKENNAAEVARRTVSAAAKVQPRETKASESGASRREAPGCDNDQTECLVELAAQVSPGAKYVGGRIDTNVGPSGENRHVLYFENPNMKPCEHIKREGATGRSTRYVLIVAGENSFGGGQSCVSKS